ncbi:hypothetical protein [Thermoflexus sp.]|uniref:hypothetical protein n=1 Tax=Thermoflexus sp. TaxID=1969742 RepID=UPI002ADD6CBC|nr:hypothetical protein [Thermoflexus sp.]
MTLQASIHDLEAALLLAGRLRPLPPVAVGLLLELFAEPEARREEQEALEALLDVLEAARPFARAVVGVDPDRLRDVRAALEALKATPPAAARLLRALSAGGARLEAAARQIDRLSGTLRRWAKQGHPGWVEAKWIPRRGKRYGPYLYVRWREGGRKRSRYRGKAGKTKA